MKKGWVVLDPQTGAEFIMGWGFSRAVTGYRMDYRMAVSVARRVARETNRRTKVALR